MAIIQNTVKFTAPISPPDTTTPWGSHYSKYGIGGLQQYDLYSQLATIPDGRKMTGSIAYAKDQDKYYKWSNSAWNQIIPLSPGATFGQSYYAGSGLSIDGNNTFSIDLSGSNGIDITSNTISIDLDNSSGLRFDSGKLTIDLYGSSLGLNSGGIYVANVPTHTHNYLPLTGGTIQGGVLNIFGSHHNNYQGLLRLINIEDPSIGISSWFENVNRVKYITQLTSPDPSVDLYKLKYYKDYTELIEQDLMTFKNNYGVTFDLDNKGEPALGMHINGIGEKSKYSERQRLLTLKTQKGTWDKDKFTPAPGWPQMLFVDEQNHNNTALTYDSSHDIFHIGYYDDYNDMETFMPFITFDKGNSVIQINHNGSMQDVYHTGNLPNFAPLSHTHGQYLRSDTSDTFTGKLTATGAGQISGSDLNISAKQIIAGAVISNGTPPLGVWPDTGNGFVATYYIDSLDTGRLFAYDGDGGYKDLGIGNWNSGNPNIMLKGNANPAVSGFVGIGIGSPQEQLHVAGNVSASYFKGDGSQLTNLPLSGQIYDNGNGLDLTNNTFSITPNYFDNDYVTKSGDSNINGTITASKIKINDNDLIITGDTDIVYDAPIGETYTRMYYDDYMEGFRIICSKRLEQYTYTSLPISLGASRESFYIQGGGSRVGIGTDSPQERLHVAGNIKSNGNITASNFSTSGKFYGDGSQLTDVGVDGLLFQNNTPTLAQIGKLPEGAVFPQDTTPQQMFNLMFYYTEHTWDYFKLMNLNTNTLITDTIYDLGDGMSYYTRIFVNSNNTDYILKTDGNNFNYCYKFNDVVTQTDTDHWINLTNTWQPETETGYIKYDIEKVSKHQVIVTSSVGTMVSKTLTAYWRQPIYYGYSTDADITSFADLDWSSSTRPKSPTTQQRCNQTVTINSPNNAYYYIIYNSGWNNLVSGKLPDSLNSNIMWSTPSGPSVAPCVPLKTYTMTNPHGANVNYKIYRTQNMLAGSIRFTLT